MTLLDLCDGALGEVGLVPPGIIEVHIMQDAAGERVSVSELIPLEFTRATIFGGVTVPPLKFTPCRCPPRP